MTNCDKYGEEVLQLLRTGKGIAVRNGKPVQCTSTPCEKCDLFSESKECLNMLADWLNAEYVEPTVDWSKVPVDTKILVRNSEDNQWDRRYFAKFDGESAFVWPYGKTSWSSYDEFALRYRYAKLAEDEHEQAD